MFLYTFIYYQQRDALSALCFVKTLKMVQVYIPLISILSFDICKNEPQKRATVNIIIKPRRDKRVSYLLLPLQLLHSVMDCTPSGLAITI